MTDSNVDASIPWALLKTVRRLDQRGPENIDEYRRLGANATVSAQITRYEGLARNGGGVPMAEVAQLFRLIGRRPDAALVFSDAGREAGREALLRVPRRIRLLRSVVGGHARQKLEFRAAGGIAARVFRVTLSQDDERGVVADGARLAELLGTDGVACGFYGSALAEVLRSLLGFGGAMLHGTCRARGDDECTWHTGNRMRW